MLNLHSNTETIITGIIVVIIEFIVIIAFVCLLNHFNEKTDESDKKSGMTGGKSTVSTTVTTGKTPVYYFYGHTVFCFKDASDKRIYNEIVKILNDNQLSSYDTSNYDVLKYDVINVYTKINEDNLKQIREDINNTSVVQSLIVVENNFDNFKFIRSIKDYAKKVTYIMVNTESSKSKVLDYDVTFGHKNFIIETDIENLDVVLYEITMIYLHNVNFENRGFSLKILKNRIINDILLSQFLRTFLHVCNNWAKKKIKQKCFNSIKLSDLNIIGQGYMNAVFSSDKYDKDKIIRVSTYHIPNRVHPDIDEERLELLINHQHKSDHPFVKIYDYELDKDDYLWVEVEKCYPIPEFDYFRGYPNYDLKKLEVLLRRVYTFLNEENKKANNGILEKEWVWADFNKGNIMQNSKGEYIIADLSLTQKLSFLKIANNVRNVFPTLADLDAKIRDIINTDDVSYIERMMILCWLVFNSKNYHEHKIDFNNDHIHVKFIYAYYYYRFMLEQKYNSKLEKAIKEGKPIEECRKIKHGFDKFNEDHIQLMMDNVDIYTL